ncbi:MAG: hypothetical protein QOG79_2774, partial [Mycobacterium sp.]|nr:hypothetical protein [Mycobacterium sp.]
QHYSSDGARRRSCELTGDVHLLPSEHHRESQRIHGCLTSGARSWTHGITCSTAPSGRPHPAVLGPKDESNYETDTDRPRLHLGDRGNGGDRNGCRSGRFIAERRGTEVFRRPIRTLRRRIHDRGVEHGRRSDRTARLRRHPPARPNRAATTEHLRFTEQANASGLELRRAGGFGEIARQLTGESRRSCRRGGRCGVCSGKDTGSSTTVITG